MGMFDSLYSSYDLGEDFTGVELQTKGFDCLLDYYWISPNGELFLYDTYDCYEVVIDDTKPLGIDHVRTGKNGKLKPMYTSGIIEVYPARWHKNPKNWPSLNLLFLWGKLQGIYEI